MKTFSIISGVLLLGALPCILAQFGPHDYQHVQAKLKPHQPNITASQYKLMVGKAVSTIADKVARIIGERTTKSEQPPVKGVPGTYPLNNPKYKYVPRDVYGVANILYYKEGIICSGVHFKPWIILTTAECVKDRDLKKLYADVTIRNNTKTGFGIQLSVQIQSVTLSPKYKPGEPQNNLALVYTFGQLEWDVEELYIPRHPLTPQEIVNRSIETFTYKWNKAEEEIYPVVIPSTVTTNYTVCDEPGTPDNYYCAERLHTTESLNEIDLGVPVFYRSGYLKRCLGIYTGRHLKKKLSGHIYEGIYPNIDWIEQFIHEHPMPAFYQ